MNETDTKLNVLPGLTVLALLLAVAASAVAIVALTKRDDANGPATSMAMSGMGAEEMGHMAPVSIAGIGEPSGPRGGVPLRGRRRGGVLEFTLRARPVWWSIFGSQRVAAWAYDGIVPGPLIRVRNGQRVRIRFTNQLPAATTIHWHGIGVPNVQDGVAGVTQQSIKPGASYTYTFTARPAGDPNGSGTFFYHSHVDEDRQMSVGLSGVFIIDPPSGARASRYRVDRALLVSEWTADATSGRTRGVMQMEGMLPNFFTINGKSYPDTNPIRVSAGRPVLLRLINAGQFAHPLHLHGTAFRIVARDGHPTGERGLRDTITLESGERADIAFSLPPGRWLLHCHIGHHMTNDGAGPGGLMTLIEATRPVNR